MNKKIRIKIKPLDNYIQKMKNEMYSNYDYDEKTVAHKIRNLFIKIILTDFLIVILMGLIYGINICMASVTIFSIYLINKMIVEKNLNTENKKILYQLPDLIDEIKSGYYEKRMVLEALGIAIKHVPYEIMQQVEKMIQILSVPNMKLEVEKYNRECNNKYLKLLMNILYITKEYGDRNFDEDGREDHNITNSIFIKNLNFLLEEVNIEITKQNLFKSKFAGLMFTTIFPILFINLIEKWSVSNFEQLSLFYDSYAGFILKNVSVLICISMSLLIIKIKDSEINIEINKNKFKTKDKKNRKYEKLINKLVPNKTSKYYNILLKKIEESNVEMSVENYFKSKINCFLVSAIFLFTMMLSANMKLECVTPKIVLIECLVITLLSLLSTMITNFNLQFEKNMKKSDKDNEINSFRCIILILIHYPFTSCEVVLNYLESYSKAYKNDIRRCINDYENSSEYALSRLYNDVKEKGMKKIVRCLEQCTKNIKVSQAFNFLETERNFYKEETKYKNEILVDEKTNLAKLISVVPYYALIFLYFIVPMIYTGINELSSLLEQVRGM